MSSRITLLTIILSCQEYKEIKTYPPGLTEEAGSVTADPWPLAWQSRGKQALRTRSCVLRIFSYS